jgi:hypothetical protein
MSLNRFFLQALEFRVELKASGLDKVAAAAAAATANARSRSFQLGAEVPS